MFFDDWKTNEKYKDSKISKVLLWDNDLQKFDFNKNRSLVVERVVKLGTMSDFYAAIRFYGGLENFIKIIRDEVTGLNSEDLSFLKTVFHINENELYSVKIKRQRENDLGYKESDLPGMEFAW